MKKIKFKIFGLLGIFLIFLMVFSLVNLDREVLAKIEPNFGNSGDGNWTMRQEIKIDHTKVSGTSTLINFPVLLTESNFSADIFDEASYDYYSQSFDDLSSGDLNGQDSWSGDTDFDVVTSDSPQSGSKHIKISTSQEPAKNISRNIDSIDNGIAYYYVKHGSTGYSRARFILQTGTTDVIYVMSSGNGIDVTYYAYDKDTEGWYTIGSSSLNTYVKIGIEFDAKNHKDRFRVNQNDGTWSDWKGTMNSYSVIDKIKLSADYNTGQSTGDAYYDSITINSLRPRDLRFSSDAYGETELPFEIVNWDRMATNSAEVWVKVPNVYYDVDTSFYAWYGNSSATPYADSDTYGRNAVWGIYSDVWHLGESSNLAIDSTGNYDGTYQGDVPDSSRGGKIGDAQDFDGTGDYITTTNSLDFSNNDFTISLWAYSDTAGDKPLISRWGGSGNLAWDFRVGWSSGSPTDAWTFMYSTDGTGGTEAGKYGDTYSTGTWKYLTAIKRNGHLYIGVDGVETDTGVFSSTIYNGTAYINIGKFSGYSSYFDGMLDEVRVKSGTGMSNDWIMTEYNNQNSPSTFFIYQEPKDITKPAAPTSLRVEGQNNPTKVTDTFPEFYATYNDSSGDNASYYQIQVATSSDYWSDPIWDSSKTAMSAATEGSRSPSISYGDSDGLAFDGATYYWRIKFWNDEDDEGDWSDGSDYFIMADSVRLQFP